MTAPLVSVIIPAYNNAEFLVDAINSVLNQSYPNFELIVVNDASPDHTEAVVKSFNDARIKYIVHEKNQGLSAARNSGICNSIGDYIALLDGDDYFHTDKLKLHVEFFEKHPDIGVTYNARFDLNHSSKTIRDFWRPPLTVDLADLILGYPFSPSDMVVRRQAMFEVGLFDKSLTYFGEDLDINCKLALAGFKFASVDRGLNYRRFHSRRRIKNLRAYQEDENQPLFRTFADHRFPGSLETLKNKALANRFMGWSILAYSQDDADLGQEYCLEAIKLNPSLFKGMPCEFLESLINFSALDENIDHENLIQKILRQLPKELDWLTDYEKWAISRGYLLKGVRAFMWGQIHVGETYLAKALTCRAQLDKPFLRQLSARLISFKAEFGVDMANEIIDNLSPWLEKFSSRAEVRWFKGVYAVNSAFKSYQLKEYTKVPKAVLNSIANDPSYILNRGVIKIFLSSLIRWAN